MIKHSVIRGNAIKSTPLAILIEALRLKVNTKWAD